jgi:transposase
VGRPRGKAAQLEKKRLDAMNLIFKEDVIPAEAARRVKVHDRTVRKWLAAYKCAGAEGLKVKVSPGRKTKLDAGDLKRLKEILLKGAVKAGFSNELWTSKRVLQVIKSHFDVKYHQNHLPKLLRNLGFSPQRPQREAVEKDRKRIQHWVDHEWKRIKKKPNG